MKYKKPFQFRQFSISQENAAMKVGADSVLLGSWAQINPSERVLDIGTGTGLLSIMLAQKTNGVCHIDAVEIDQITVMDAIINIVNCKWNYCIQLHEQDFNNFQSTELYDVVISNPPFYEGAESPIDSRNIARSSLAKLDFKSLLTGGSDLLKWGGRFYLVLPTKVLNKIALLAIKVKLQLKRALKIHPISNKPSNRVLVEFSKTESIMEPVTSQLTIRLQDLNYTEAYIDFTKAFYLNL